MLLLHCKKNLSMGSFRIQFIFEHLINRYVEILFGMTAFALETVGCFVKILEVRAGSLSVEVPACPGGVLGSAHRLLSLTPDSSFLLK